MQSNIELIFVYNADSGVFKGVKDLIHKSISPKTYGCNLCGLTYSGAKMKREWREFIDLLHIKATFFHKDEFAKTYPRYAMTSYPIIFKRDKAALKEFISTDEIKRQKDLKELEKLVLDKIKTCK